MKKLFTLFCAVSFVINAFASGHVVTVTGVNLNCNGVCNGSATASVTGGVGPFSFNWSPVSGTSATIAGLCAGNYTVTVIDSSDMSMANANVAITQPAPVVATASGGSSICQGSSVSLTTSVSGGIGSVTYSWTPTTGLSNPNISNPTAAPTVNTTYIVLVTDANGCMDTGQTTVTVNPLNNASFNYSSSVYCVSGSNPYPTITGMVGGVFFSSGGLALNMSTGEINLGASTIGSYAISYTTPGPCSNTSSVNITITSAPLASFSYAGPFCSNEGNQLPNFSAGASAGVFSSTPGLAFVSTSTGEIDLQNTVPGTYTVTNTIAASGGCAATSATGSITINPLPVSSITSTPTSSCVACDGTATAAASGGTPPYAYYWPMGGITTQSANGLCSGANSLRITDANGCITDDTIIIYRPNTVIANFTMVPDSAIAMKYWGFNSSTVGMSYTWQFGDGGTSAFFSPSYTYATSGTRNVCLSVTSTTSGCYSTLCKLVPVTSAPASCLALFNVADDTSSTDPNARTIYNLSYGATLSYSWDFGDGTTSTLQTPAHLYSGTGPYQICLTVNNGSGCTQTYCDSIMVIDSFARLSTPLSLTVVNAENPSFATGINEQNKNSFISVYPNPFSESTTFIIQSDKTQMYSFEMKDILGKTVNQMNTSEKQFTVSKNGLQNGMYFYSITNADGIIGKGKLIIK